MAVRSIRQKAVDRASAMAAQGALTLTVCQTRRLALRPKDMRHGPLDQGAARRGRGKGAVGQPVSRKGRAVGPGDGGGPGAAVGALASGAAISPMSTSASAKPSAASSAAIRSAAQPWAMPFRVSA